ncbi:MAG TPA: hypothetical protein VHX63_15145 [Acidobacteriaceae bacterium]|jgi:hypothetical protein|nr:hypothetical protein [Acidobacteriaceae bacterium]
MTNQSTHPNHPGHPDHPDSDEHKGAFEDDSPHKRGDEPEPHNYLRGQIGHRSNTDMGDDMLRDNDSDYPEPGSNPEHSGQHK